MRTFSIILVITAALILQIPPQPAPPIGWVARATVAPEDVYDGDTFTATVQVRVRVRLLDCWAPEVRGEDKARGIVSRDALRKMIANGDGKVTIFVPTTERLSDSFSFGRVLGHAWSSDYSKKPLSLRMVEGGFAKETKK